MEKAAAGVCVCLCAHARACRMEYYSAIKMKEILPFAVTWLKLESTMLSKIILSEKDSTV